MQIVRFYLSLEREQILAYYQGAARQVVVTATDGRRIQFPVENLRPYVAADGIHGWFEMRLSEQHKLIDLRRVEKR